MSTLVRHIYSNSTEILAKELGQKLFCSSARPFEKRLVIVPSQAMKDYLVHFFAWHPDYQVFAGVRILPLADAFLELLELSDSRREKVRIPSVLELSLRIEELMWQVEHLSGEDRKILQPLIDYLGSTDRHKRIGALSTQLGSLFSRYGLYGSHFLNTWLEDQTWQQWMWKQVYQKEGFWTYPIKALECLQRNLQNHSSAIHLFGFSSMPQVYLQLFSRLKSFFYIVSPCSYFWEDVATDRERIGLRRYLEKQDVKEKDLNAWEGFLRDTNPLLANWGKAGREFAKLLGEQDLVSEEAYVEPVGMSVLECVQRGLLNLENPQSPQTSDGSIQIHSADSLLREVEILYDQLCRLVEEDGLELKTILVLAPNLNLYAPFIQTVFGSPDSAFAYSLEGVVNRPAKELFDAIIHLLVIPSFEFSLESILRLLSFPCFVEKWGVSADDIGLIQKWFKQGSLDFDRLLLGAVMDIDEDAACDVESSVLPCSLIDVADLPLLGKFMELIDCLKRDLKPICLNHNDCVHGWLDYLQSLITRYFNIGQGQEGVIIEIEKLRSHLPQTGASVFPATTLNRVIQTLAEAQSTTLSMSNAQKVAFRSLSAGNITESKVIWLLGMDEGSFPRQEVDTSLCLMQGQSFPRKGDEDRYLTLEALLLTKKRLMISYQRIDSRDNKEQSPSLLIQELMQYTGVSLVSVHHPSLSFDRSYLAATSFSQKNYKNAVAYYSGKRQLDPFFVPLQSTSPLEVVDLKALSDLAKDPIRFYFQQVLQIFIRSEEDEAKDFILSSLSRAILRKKAWKRKKSVRELAGMWKAQGKLPIGVFGEAAIDALEEEVNDLKEQLASFQIKAEEIFSVELSPVCSSPYLQGEDHWILPSPIIPMQDGSEVRLTGVLENLTPRGFLFHGEDKLQDWVKLWPHLLVLSSLRHVECPSCALLTRCGKIRDGSCIDPIPLIQDYLAYYKKALCELSLLVPTWVSSLLFETPLELEKAMAQTMNAENPYVEWLKRRRSLPEAQEIFARWSAYAKELYRPMLELWKI